MRMILSGDSLNCGTCHENWSKSLQKAKEHPKLKIHSPSCWDSYCRNSKYQLSSIDDWIAMLMQLKTFDVIKSGGLGRELLEWSDALDPETVGILCQLEALWNRLEAEKRQAESQS